MMGRMLEVRLRMADGTSMEDAMSIARESASMFPEATDDWSVWSVGPSFKVGRWVGIGDEFDDQQMDPIPAGVRFLSQVYPLTSDNTEWGTTILEWVEGPDEFRAVPIQYYTARTQSEAKRISDEWLPAFGTAEEENQWTSP